MAKLVISFDYSGTLPLHPQIYKKKLKFNYGQGGVTKDTFSCSSTNNKTREKIFSMQICI